MVHLIDLYRCTNHFSLQYISNYTECVDIWYIKIIDVLFIPILCRIDIHHHIEWYSKLCSAGWAAAAAAQKNSNQNRIESLPSISISKCRWTNYSEGWTPSRIGSQILVNGISGLITAIFYWIFFVLDILEICLLIAFIYQLNKKLVSGLWAITHIIQLKEIPYYI